MSTSDTKTFAPVLALDTSQRALPPRHVVIDGTPYRLLHAHELPLPDFGRMPADSFRIGDLLKRDELTDDERAEVDRLLDRGCRSVLAAPSDVRATLNAVQKFMILNAFLGITPGAAAAAPVKKARKARRG